MLCGNNPKMKLLMVVYDYHILDGAFTIGSSGHLPVGWGGVCFINREYGGLNEAGDYWINDHL